MERRGQSSSHDELTLFGFKEQKQNENYKQTLAKYNQAPNN